MTHMLNRHISASVDNFEKGGDRGGKKEKKIGALKEIRVKKAKVSRK